MDVKRRKRLFLAALSVSGLISLTSCSYKEQMDREDKNKYFKKIDVNYKENDNLSYEIVSNMNVTFITNLNKAYLVINKDKNGKYGYDYFTGRILTEYTSENMPMLLINRNMDDFLNYYNFIKESYSDEDLRFILKQIQKDYEVVYVGGYDYNKYSYVLKRIGEN